MTRVTVNPTIESQLHYHLNRCHNPPIGDWMIPFCKQVIENARNDDWDALVGGTPIRQVVEKFQLHWWLEGGQDPDDY